MSQQTDVPEVLENNMNDFYFEVYGNVFNFFNES